MNLSAIHNHRQFNCIKVSVVCDIGGYEFVSYSQLVMKTVLAVYVVCDIGGYEFVSYSQPAFPSCTAYARCL